MNGKKLQTPQDATVSKVTMSTTKRMVMAHSPGNLAIFTMEIMSMTRGMDTEKCIGQMAQSIKVSGKRESSTEEES